MMRTTQGGALLEDRPGRNEPLGDRSQIRERNSVWKATEGKASSPQRTPSGSVAGVGSARPGRRLCRRVSPERHRQPAAGGCRCRVGDARIGESACDPGAGHRDGRCKGRGAHHSCPRALRTIGSRQKYPKCPRQPGLARRAAPGTIERSTTPSGCESRGPQCGGATP